jgi:hypothetical protein
MERGVTPIPVDDHPFSHYEAIWGMISQRVARGTQ